MRKLAFNCVICLVSIFFGQGVLAQMNKVDYADSNLHCQHSPSDCLQGEGGKSVQHEQTTEELSRPILHKQSPSIFGAISEISEVIERENIDWANVDIDALWEHLRDMNSLMIYTSVQRRKLSNGLLMNVTGGDNAARAMDEMIPAHSNFLRRVRPEWDISLKKIEKGYSIRMVFENDNEALKIKARGFSGFMVQDNHHAAHHFAMALSENVHSTLRAGSLPALKRGRKQGSH